MKNFYFKFKNLDKDFERFCNLVTNQSYGHEEIFKLYDVKNNKTLRIMFFHNDKPNSEDGLNTKSIENAKKAILSNKIDFVVCCYAGYTGINKKYLLLQDSAYAEIRTINTNKKFVYGIGSLS